MSECLFVYVLGGVGVERWNESMCDGYFECFRKHMRFYTLVLFECIPHLLSTILIVCVRACVF